jgi:hypothetical protein
LAASEAVAVALDVLDASEARGPWRAVEGPVLEAADGTRLLTSAAAPVVEVFAAVRVALGAEDVVVAVLEVVVAGRAVVVLLVVLVAVAGFLAAAVVAAVLLDLVLVGEVGVVLGAKEVRREAVPVAEVTDGRFFSSSDADTDADTDGRERCETVEAAVDGRFAAAVPVVDVVAGRVAGLAVVVVVVLLVVELAADFVDAVLVVPGFRAAEGVVVAGRFVVAAPAAAFFSATPLGDLGDLEAATSAGGAASVGDSGVGVEAGASAGASTVGWATSTWASDMAGDADRRTDKVLDPEVEWKELDKQWCCCLFLPARRVSKGWRPAVGGERSDCGRQEKGKLGTSLARFGNV